MADEVKKKVKKEKIPRVSMPEQEPDVRAHNFLEVPTGYTPEMAMQEAKRCLQCKKPACVAGCPVEIDIPGFIKLIAAGEFTQSIRHIWQKNALPAVCGRVCPQEIQSEKKLTPLQSEIWKDLPQTGKEKTAPARCRPRRSQPVRKLPSSVPVHPV
jgi:CO dehydrogenase/acetyl-CoA synthase alpha subunit